MVYQPARSTTYNFAVNRGLTRANYQTVSTETYRPSTVYERPYKTPMNFAFVEASRRQKRPTTKAPRTTSHFVADKNDTATATASESSRDFSFTTAGFDDDAYPTMISYPVAPEDYCDCITIPDDTDFAVDICTDDVKWGASTRTALVTRCSSVSTRCTRVAPQRTLLKTSTGTLTAQSTSTIHWKTRLRLVSSQVQRTLSRAPAGSDEAIASISSVDQSMTITSGEGSASEEETITDQDQGASSSPPRSKNRLQLRPQLKRLQPTRSDRFLSEC
ncbi:hypothetical protein PHYSODRAFT_302834 [Phytophthora sojae]|uniref:Uncharacterized protein n=1 Tax=Phytophthora sojae (strain P6497) TaxID=1094619 RepID=G4ZSZ1_PHYSP|nr:hypothetical protein PHYSODRAFT_302834 [Phytophthora sojae]EGZ13076.1 hypothetical protein PHYSODRAFT_302834 [Phytophthora sojae]|eukprot:XP_009530505.1 hypothetical protein PHYSODRAFT_302834 [Phytophthora sojae]